MRLRTMNRRRCPRRPSPFPGGSFRDIRVALRAIENLRGTGALPEVPATSPNPKAIMAVDRAAPGSRSFTKVTHIVIDDLCATHEEDAPDPYHRFTKDFLAQWQSVLLRVERTPK